MKKNTKTRNSKWRFYSDQSMYRKGLFVTAPDLESAGKLISERLRFDDWYIFKDTFIGMDFDQDNGDQMETHLYWEKV